MEQKEKLKLLVLQGIPASGKSTWAREFIKGKESWIIVNRDSVRNMLGDYWAPAREGLVDLIEEDIMISSSNLNYNIIVDATNLNPLTILKWEKFAEDNNMEIEFRRFNIALDEAIRRDSLRENPVGAKVIKNFYFKYIDSDKSGIKTDNRFILEQNRKLENCIIVDVDGTLALINGRNVYDDSLVHTDKPNTPVVDLVKHFIAASYTKIIILSGREDKCMKQTTDWLIANIIYFDQIFMRKTGDNRKDSVVKREIYEEHIKDKYYVQFVLDDRNQVVDMWRELGLLCLQVYYGDF